MILKRWRKEYKVKQPRIIISGGGTGGHVFPAISIANAIKMSKPDAEILFVGALGKIEMDKVPAAGYKIIGLDIRGLQRNFSFENLKFPIRLIKSLIKSRSVVKNFKPDVAVGVGGYASGPLLYIASLKRIPCLLQEQNSYPGITNKFLAKYAQKICVAFDGMEKYFDPKKILFTGNPVRQSLRSISLKKKEALVHFNLSEQKKTILLIGGSLGSKTLNESVRKDIQKIINDDVQLIWQTGKTYYSTIVENVQPELNEGVRIFEFINNMDMAYAAADVIVSRAGAGTISELCLVGKPVILVPSPNVAEDHQTKNAMSLVRNKAAWMISDGEARQRLIDTALMLLKDEDAMQTLSTNIGELATPDAAEKIANEVLKLVERKK